MNTKDKRLKEAAKHRNKAESQYYEYQETGNPHTLAASDRNHFIADTYTDAAKADDYKNALNSLRSRIIYEFGNSTDEAVKTLVKDIYSGMYQ